MRRKAPASPRRRVAALRLAAISLATIQSTHVGGDTRCGGATPAKARSAASAASHLSWKDNLTISEKETKNEKIFVGIEPIPQHCAAHLLHLARSRGHGHDCGGK